MNAVFRSGFTGSKGLNRLIGDTCSQMKGRIGMNWDQVKGSWKQVQGQVKQKWGKLTDDDLSVVAGKRDELAGVLQQKYGVAKEQAERELDDFVNSIK